MGSVAHGKNGRFSPVLILWYNVYRHRRCGLCSPDGGGAMAPPSNYKNMAISIGAIEQAIIQYKGNITRVAESFDVSRQAITKRVNKSSTLKDALRTARDMRNDSVTDTLYDMAVTDRVPSAAIFIAKTQMGWKETQVTENTGEIVYKLDWGDVANDSD